MLFTLALAISQQGQIATAHQFDAEACQTNAAVAQLVGLPAGTGWNACNSEQALRDDAIALAGQAPVQCTKREAEPHSTLSRQPLRRTHVRAPGNDTPQPQCCGRARGKIRIERNDDC